MSWIFLKRFLSRPFQVASVVPSSPAIVKKVSDKMDFSRPRVIAEFGPGEGCHTREILRRLQPGSMLLLFELDPELAAHLEKQFRHDTRVVVLHTDAGRLGEELAARGLPACDYVVSGIPFSTMQSGKKRRLLETIHQCLVPEAHAAFIIYQVTNELKRHAVAFPSSTTEYCLANIPPMFVTVFHRLPAPALAASGEAGAAA
jgi:phosphatidylethanolamine/phosphatidyl-N-methylethanolamine N-methyltransferase